MLKTPEEIKKGLICVCDSPECENCAYATKVEDKEFGEILQFHCSEIYKDAYDLIIHLESSLAQAERERDAAINDCGRFPCQTCEERENGDLCSMCVVKGSYRSLHQWRGVVEENTGRDEHGG